MKISKEIVATCNFETITTSKASLL